MLAKFPAGQIVHRALAAAATLPGAHVAHAVAAAELKAPGRQTLHDVPLRNWPAAQDVMLAPLSIV